MKIVVIDGQGGNIGKGLVRSIREEFPEVSIRVIGTNSTATANMLKAGADEGATGENAAVVGAAAADIIVGPIGIIIPDALLGEVSEKMANAIARSSAQKVLIPLNRCDVYVAGAGDLSTTALLSSAMKTIRAIMNEVPAGSRT